MTSLCKYMTSAILAVNLLVLSSCQTGGGGGVIGNENGSQPINAVEAKAYQKAVTRCYKTGGSRVVKIEGQLRCY